MKLKIALAAAMLATPSFAQQPPQQDPALVLLNEANARVVEIARQLNVANERAQRAEARVKELEKATEQKPAKQP